MSEQELTAGVEKAMSLGAAPFTVLCVVAFGYVLRLIPNFPNRWIPVACVVVGMIVFPLMATRHVDDTLRDFLIRTLFMGMIIGLGSVRFHEAILARYEDKIPWLGKLLNNETKPEPKNENKP